MTHATAKHTPTPWKQIDKDEAMKIMENKFYSVSFISSPNNELIAETMDVKERKDISQNNARHIVHCVNCHDELIAGCRKALQDLYTYHPLFKSASSIKLLEQALAKAEEK